MPAGYWIAYQHEPIGMHTSASGLNVILSMVVSSSLVGSHIN
jgi:hypothetical protein